MEMIIGRETTPNELWVSFFDSVMLYLETQFSNWREDTLKSLTFTSEKQT